MLYELLSQQRSGSTYMFRVLKFYLGGVWKNKSIAKDNEPFNKWEGEKFNPAATVTEIKKLITRQRNVVLKNHALHLHKLLELHPTIYNDFIKIPRKRIVLLRHDQFQKTASSIVAKHYEIWVEQPANIKPIYVDPDIFRWTYKEIIDEYNVLKSMITQDDLVIEYEHLTFWPRQDFYNLGLSDQPFDSLPRFKETKKNKPKNETVTNLAELEHIYKTEFV